VLPRSAEGETVPRSKPHFEIHPLESPGHLLVATGLNHRGDVCGFVQPEALVTASKLTGSQFERAGLITTPGVGPRVIRHPDGVSCEFTGINDHGHASGLIRQVDQPPAPFLWTESRGFLPLEVPEGATVLTCGAINNLDQVLFTAWYDDAICSFLYTSKEGVTLLSGLPGYEEVHAVALNDTGCIVGSVSTRYTSQAVTWRDGTPTALPGLGGSSSAAAAINRSGVVVGDADSGRGIRSARWETDGTVSELKRVSGHASRSGAASINDLGQIVGVAYRGVLDMDPMVWGGASRYRLFDLIDRDAGWTLGYAHTINNQGEILITAKHRDQPRQLRSLLLHPLGTAPPLPHAGGR
jgi:hypothetical protein